jgi:Inward rectifier potassium channel C-terminal domain
VVEPKVNAYLYTWGDGRVTAEGEYIPLRVEQLDIAYIDGMLLLPITIEHTIDETSPLCGHTYDSLSVRA